MEAFLLPPIAGEKGSFLPRIGAGGICACSPHLLTPLARNHFRGFRAALKFSEERHVPISKKTRTPELERPRGPGGYCATGGWLEFFNSLPQLILNSYLDTGDLVLNITPMN
jgi:hypothetical protein